MKLLLAVAVAFCVLLVSEAASFQLRGGDGDQDKEKAERVSELWGKVAEALFKVTEINKAAVENACNGQSQVDRVLCMFFYVAMEKSEGDDEIRRKVFKQMKDMLMSGQDIEGTCKAKPEELKIVCSAFHILNEIIKAEAKMSPELREKIRQENALEHFFVGAVMWYTSVCEKKTEKRMTLSSVFDLSEVCGAVGTMLQMAESKVMAEKKELCWDGIDAEEFKDAEGEHWLAKEICMQVFAEKCGFPKDDDDDSGEDKGKGKRSEEEVKRSDLPTYVKCRLGEVGMKPEEMCTNCDYVKKIGYFGPRFQEYCPGEDNPCGGEKEDEEERMVDRFARVLERIISKQKSYK